MKFKNKFYSTLELMFNPVQMSHTKLNDFMYRNSIKKMKFNEVLKIKGNLSTKTFYDNLFNSKSRLNIHYTVFKPNYYIIDNTVASIFRINNLNTIQVSDNFVANKISQNADYYLKFENIPKYEALRKIKGNYYYLETEIKANEELLKINPDDAKAQKKLEDYTQMHELIKVTIDNMQNDVNSTISKFNIMFNKKYENSDFKNVIDPEFQEFRHSIQEEGHFVRRTTNKQQFELFDYVNTLDPVEYIYYIYSVNEATGNLYPAIYPSFINSNKVIFGNYLDTGMPILKDLWDLDSQNGIIIGQMGSGKSATSKSFLTRNLMFKNRKIIVIDPQGEYLYVTKMAGGEYINILQSNKKSTFTLNIFDKAAYDIEDKGTGTAFSLKVNDVAEFIALAVTTDKENELKQNPIYNQFLTTLIISFYNKFGINAIEDIDENSPTLTDFIEYVNEINENYKSNSAIMLFNKSFEKNDINFENYKSAMTYITAACETLKLPEYSIFRGKTNINLSNKFITFNTAGLPEKLQILVTYVIMNYVIKTMNTGLSEDKLFLIDEGWKILSMLGSNYIKIIAKTSRKFRLGLIITTQQIADLDSDEGRALVENIQFAYLYRVQGDDKVMNSLKQLFKLSDDDIYFLKNYAGSSKTALDKSARGILRLKDDNYRIKFVLTEDEIKFAESNPEKLMEIVPKEIINKRKEIQELENEIANKQDKKINVEHEEAVLKYLNTILDTLRDIKANIERNSMKSIGYDEENVRKEVLNDNGIYSLGTGGNEMFGDGINIDESIYLINNGYKEIQTSDELEEIFGPEMFYVKTVSEPKIAIYNKFLINQIKANHKNKLIGDIIEEQNDIIMRIKVMKNSGSFYVYHPDTDQAELWEIENEKLTIKPTEKKSYFEKNIINPNFIYIYALDTKKEIIYPKEQEELIKDKMLYTEKRVQIRTLSEYFTPFSNQDFITEKTDRYYVLFKNLYDEKATTSGIVEKNIFRYNEYFKLLNSIFS